MTPPLQRAAQRRDQTSATRTSRQPALPRPRRPYWKTGAPRRRTSARSPAKIIGGSSSQPAPDLCAESRGYRRPSAPASWRRTQMIEMRRPARERYAAYLDMMPSTLGADEVRDRRVLTRSIQRATIHRIKMLATPSNVKPPCVSQKLQPYTTLPFSAFNLIATLCATGGPAGRARRRA